MSAVDVIVSTSGGKVRGLREPDMCVFKGIPYGADMGGRNRFRPPQAPARWTGVRDATAFGPMAAQIRTSDFIWLGEELSALMQFGAEVHPEPQSEDCLLLNVWTPSVDENARRPVIVRIHGGGLSTGSVTWQNYHGANVVRANDVVFVSVNHRLGAFGYLYLDQISGGEYSGSGNAALLDLVQALQWVKDNIEEFGGDPSNVTIVGESGGGVKVVALMAMPQAQGLFRRVVSLCGPGIPFASPDAASALTERFLHHLGLDSKSWNELDAIPVEKLLAAHVATVDARAGLERPDFGPVVDGAVYAAQPREALRAGSAAGVDLIIGCAKDESLMFLLKYPDYGSMNDEAVVKLVAGPAGTKAAEVVSSYRALRPDMSSTELLVAAMTDGDWRIPEIQIAEAQLSGGGGAGVYMYLYAWDSPLAGGRYKCMHGLDVGLWAGQTGFGDAPPQRDFAQALIGALGAFARSGDPNHGGLPHWPPYSTAARATLVIDDPIRIDNDPFGDTRTIWDWRLQRAQA